MKKTTIIILISVLFLTGCKEEERKWEKVVEAKVVKIEIVGVGGYGSPNSCRVWTLDNGMVISMNGWKNEEVAIGDTVVKYLQITGCYKGRTRWRKW